MRSGLDPMFPAFKKAAEACQRFMPGGEDTLDQEEQAKRLQEALEFSACMRENGVPS